ncbi:MAG: type I 3-dehydroquinate dehydratase [Ruminococcaceae bacterium]|nr:type I 3-dehydroquinate dehydratase [Oscillospiraceae bacterium]
MKPTFLGHDKPLKTVMIIKRTPKEIIDEIALARAAGADAVGFQLEKLLPEYRTEECYKAIFNAAGELPTYFTFYRRDSEAPHCTDDEIAEELKKMTRCGGTIADVMGDLFCKTEGELTDDPEAIEKQKKLIAEIHELGGEVLMSSHVLKYTPSDRVMEIANAHKDRGADICKIVTDAKTDTEQIDNLMIIDRLKRELDLPFLFLCGTKCDVLRRLGPRFGCCMWLCVYDHDDLAVKIQPKIVQVNAVMNALN